MKDFIYINTFFNMIYGNESAYIRDIQSYQFIKEFINWLDIYHISMPVLSSLQEIDLNMIASCRRITDVDHILHKPLSKEIKEKLINKVQAFKGNLSKSKIINLIEEEDKQ